MNYILKETELLGMEIIQDLIELSLWSTYVKGERIVSLMIVAEPESAKTELMKKYSNNKGTITRRRFTSFGIIKDLLNKKSTLLFTSPKILGHIFVYDYATVFTFKANIVDNTIEFLDALTEEGLSAESAYWIEGEELKPYENLKGGVIAGINTFGFFTSSGKVKSNLYKGGWFSRNIVVSYGVSEVIVTKIFDSITKGKYRYDQDLVKKITIKFPQKRTNVAIPDEYAKQIETLAREIAEEYSNDLKPHKLKGFRLHKSLISLVKASALRNGGKEVSEEDVERIKYLSNWMNLQLRHLKSEYPFNKKYD
ncbi:MAG: hypothetical protein IAX22_06550 [Candidatus Bathyarchaeota archaeon]|nr:hypothetical protein [Candidatus Bathyarchaeota archaeon]